MQQFRELNVNVSPVEPDAEEVFEIMECNWPSFTAFIACASQWRVVPAVSGSMAGIATTLIFLGLDHTAVDVTLRRLDAQAHVFEDILAMADAALPVLNEVDA